MKLNADLHIHSKYSSGVSKKMDFETLSHYAEKKGIDLLGTGDCFHPKWRKRTKSLEKETESIYSKKDIKYILTGEVETDDRVHHLLIFPSISKVEELYERLKRFSSNIDKEGRPRVDLSSEELSLMAKESSALFGPSHAFTPYTGLYGTHDSLFDAYGEYTDQIYFLELGLSADASYANKLSELHDLVYLSNSDAHSAYPHRLAREFNRLELSDMSFKSLSKLLKGKKGKVVQNVGLPPEKGKYNRSACNNCYTKYTLEEAISRNLRCRCGSPIKKGVKDRVEELSDVHKVKSSSPPYFHVIPLQEIIANAVEHSSPKTKKVNKIWERLVSEFGNEIRILCEVKVDKIRDVAGEETASLIEKFRLEEVEISPGGGGKYGEIFSKKGEKTEKSQSTLKEF